MTYRRRISTRERLKIFEANKGLCHICGEKIHGTHEPWDIEHVIPLEMGGDEAKGSDNLKPAHKACHREKTKTDAGQIAKAKRVYAKHHGAFETRQKLPGGKKSKWKKKVSGEVVLR